MFVHGQNLQWNIACHSLIFLTSTKKCNCEICIEYRYILILCRLPHFVCPINFCVLVFHSHFGNILYLQNTLALLLYMHKIKMLLS